MVVCDTAKVRFFKQITTREFQRAELWELFAILQKYDFSSKSQPKLRPSNNAEVVCDTAKVRFFKQITTSDGVFQSDKLLFAILQKYDFSSKSQLNPNSGYFKYSCLRYCKSTIFQANHNYKALICFSISLFAILQKYDFSSKSQLLMALCAILMCCLRYCKSTIFQANHNLVCC